MILQIQRSNEVNQTDFKKDIVRNHVEERRDSRGLMSDLFFEESPYGQRL